MHGMSGDDVEMLRSIRRGKESGEQEQPAGVWKTYLLLEHVHSHEHLRQESIDRLRQFVPGFGFRIAKLESRLFDGSNAKKDQN